MDETTRMLIEAIMAADPDAGITIIIKEGDKQEPDQESEQEGYSEPLIFGGSPQSAGSGTIDNAILQGVNTP